MHYIMIRHKYTEHYPYLTARNQLLKETLLSLHKQTNQNFNIVIITREDLNIPNVTQIRHKSFLTVEPTDIVTRLDNDDILLPEFVETIQRYVSKGYKVVDTKGYRYHQKTKRVVIFNNYSKRRSSPFVSMLGKNPHDYKHSLANRYGKTMFVPKELWVQRIHNTNKLMRWSVGSASYIKTSYEQSVKDYMSILSTESMQDSTRY